MNLRKYLIDTYCVLLRALKGVDSKKALFISYNGASYSDNPKAISKALHEICPDADIVWAMKSPESKKDIVPEYVRMVNMGNSTEINKELSTAAVVVNNGCLAEIPKSSKQYFIQAWHGDRAFKKILYDSPFSSNFSVAESKEGYCDLALAGSKYGEMQFRSAFHYKGEISMVGTPRNDKLVKADKEEISKIRAELSIPEDTKILLYAPTLRRNTDNGAQQAQDIDIEKTLKALEAKYGCSWCCIVRAHPAVKGLSGLNYDGKRIIDVTKFEDMADLLLVSDMLITDYSSCAGDFALLNRPVVLYQADRAEYLEKDRTFYFEMSDSPYYIAENQGELEAIIADFSEEAIVKNCKDILDFYTTSESGEASKIIAQRICGWFEKIK